MKRTLLFFLFFSVSIVVFSQKSFEKLTAAPNPFSNTTTISFHSTNTQTVNVIVRNVLGKTVFKQQLSVKKGRNSLPFNRGNLKAGIYLYAIQNNKEVISKRFVIK